MSDDGFDDSFEDIVNGTADPNKDIFDKLFDSDFEDEDTLFDLSSNERYPKIVLNFQTYCNQIPDQSQNIFFDYISGLVHLLQKLSQLGDSDILQLWITSDKQKDHCILSTIFRFLPNCYLQLCLPKYFDISDNTDKFKISFFEHLALNVCKFVATLTPQLFHGIEPLLFKQLMSPQSVCHILASDVLCFVARFSKDALCYQFCSILMNIAEHTSDTLLPNISSLINRLLPYLQDIELECMLKDNDVFANSRVWRLLDISRVLKDSQIKEIIDRLMTFVDEAKPINKYSLDIVQNLFSTNELDNNIRDKFFRLFSANFFDSVDSEMSAKFLSIMSALLPQELDDYFVDNLFDKLDQTFVEKDWFETYLTFLTRLAQTKTSYPAEKRVAILINRFILQIYANSYNYYEKFIVFKALENITTKTKTIGPLVLKECLQNLTLKHEFKLYVKKVDLFRKSGERMSINDKIQYLQSLESKLCGQKNFETNQVNSRPNGPIMSQMSASMEENTNGSLNSTLCEEDSNVPLIEGLINSIEENVNQLKQQSAFTRQQVDKINEINGEFNYFVFKIND